MEHAIYQFINIVIYQLLLLLLLLLSPSSLLLSLLLLIYIYIYIILFNFLIRYIMSLLFTTIEVQRCENDVTRTLNFSDLN